MTALSPGKSGAQTGGARVLEVMATIAESVRGKQHAKSSSGQTNQGVYPRY